MAGSVTIYGQEISPKIGSIIKPDSWAWANELVACDWEPAEFRLKTDYKAEGPYLRTPSGYVEIACNVEVTGRTFQRRAGSLWVRVRITFVGDGEPDQVCGGWMLVS